MKGEATERKAATEKRHYIVSGYVRDRFGICSVGQLCSEKLLA
jgi:hypothetical protein